MLQLLRAIRIKLFNFRLSWIDPFKKAILFLMKLLLCLSLSFSQMFDIYLNSLPLHLNKQLAKRLPIYFVKI